jgi:23S rRNA pseudouridine1911/1915/1917 synthase
MLNQGWIYRDRPQPAHVGLTVLDFFAQTYRHSTREEWGDRLAREQILIDGEVAKADQILQKNQQIEYHRDPWEEPDAPLNYEILHQETDFLIINKPAGLPVLPGGYFLENSLLHQLRHHFPNETPIPIHRLGRGTSGLMILARSPLAKNKLSQQLRQHQITKVYRALIPPGDYPNRLTINTPIGKVFHPILGTIHAADPQGKFSQSEMTVVRRSPDSSIVEMDILTGRPHQIRIHLASIGYPLIGDPLYGTDGLPMIATNPAETSLPGECGYHLHAHHLKFLHPQDQRELEFIAPAPAILSLSR